MIIHIFYSSVIVLFSLYKILIGFIFVEYTNVPINLPKLVNAMHNIGKILGNLSVKI